MAIIHLDNTQLEPKAPSQPLNKHWMIALAFMFVVAMHFFIPNIGGSALMLPFNATTWMALSVAIALGMTQLYRYQAIRYSKLTIALLLCCLLMTLPFFFPHSMSEYALPRLAGLWAGYLLFLLLQQFKLSNKHKLRLLWFIVIAATLEALLGYAQYFYSLPIYVLGKSQNTHIPYGIFQQSDVMASFLATGLILSAYLLSRQPVKYHRTLSATSLLYLLPTLTLPLIIALSSAIGWVSTAISTLLVLPYLYRYAIRQRFWGWLMSLGLGALLGLSLNCPSLNESKSIHIQDPALSIQQRSDIWLQSLDMVIEKPLTGYGYGRFESQYLLYTARQHQLNPNYPAGYPSLTHPSNELLLWTIEGGALPLIGLILATCMVLFRIYTAKNGTRLAMLALFLPIALNSLFNAVFSYSAIHWITFIILLFWVDQRVARYKTFSFSHNIRKALKFINIILLVSTWLYMISALYSNAVLTQYYLTSKPRSIFSPHTTLAFGVWRDRFDQERYHRLLQFGLNQQRPDLLKSYIQWAQHDIQHSPQPQRYQALMLAYQALGDEIRMKQVQNEAYYLYPNLSFTMKASSSAAH